MQARVTRNGLQKLSEVVPPVINDAFADGFCIAKNKVIDATIAEATICDRNQATCTPGCHIPLNIDAVNMSVPNDQVMRFYIQFDVGPVVLPIDYEVFFLFSGSCNVNANISNAALEADIRFGIDPATGELTIHLDSIRRVDLSGVSLSGCGGIADIVDAAIDLFDTLINSFVGSFLLDLITPLIDDLIQGFIPDPLGLEGIVDVGSFLGSISPGTNALLETKLLPGGYVSLPAEGLSLGVITGFNADEDISTRTPDLDSEPALCVPPFAAPDFSAAPHNLTKSSRNFFKLDPADAFLGSPDPANDLVVGVSETFLDLTGHHAVSSGALCLGVGTELIPQLNLGLIGLLVPSLAELGSESGEDPLMLVLRPTKPLDFTVGVGTEEDPNLTIHFEGLEVDFYAFLFERYVRGFTISLTMDAGLNLSFTLDDMGNPALEPQLVGLSADEIELTVHNSEFLREDAATLEQVLPSIFDLALPLISDGLGAFTLPDISGFTLTDISITKVTTSEDDFLALYATLVASSAMMTAFGDDFVRPGGAFEHWIEENSLPERNPVDTNARLVDVRVPRPEVVRAWMASRPEGKLPEVELELDPSDPQGRQLEWTWRLDNGFWRPWTTESHLVIAERALGIQGRHSVDVKARAVGDQRSIDMTPVHYDFIVDSAGPRIHTKSVHLEGGNLVVTANDLVMPNETIEYAFGVGAHAAEPATEWRSEGTLTPVEADALVEDGMVTVFARDELGNVSSDNIDTRGIVGFHGRTQGDGGCGQCNAATGPGAGLGAGLLALLVLLALGFGRHARTALGGFDRRTLHRLTRWLPVIALFVVSSFAPACSCDGDPGGGPSCEIDADCSALCPDGQIGICFEGECLCADDIPYGDIGQYSDVAVSSSGAAWVSAYNRKHGDLMIARWPESGRIPNEAWEFVDGVPDGPIALPDSDVRGGIFEAGEDVGLYTSIAVSSSDVVMASYFDKDGASLKFVTNVNGTWENHVVDKGSLQGDPELGYEIIGQYSSITVRADDGRPGIAYFAQINEGGGTMRTELRFAAAQTATPSSTSDWAKFIVDTATVTLPEPDPAGADPYIIPEGVGLFIDSTRAPDGSPVLVYYDRINGDLKMVRFDPLAGVFGAPVVLDGADGTDVGWYPSVAVDTDDVAHVSYLSATSDDLVYINETDLVPQLVDDGYRIDGTTDDGLPKPVFHFVGDDSSIVITNAGPVIIYQDSTSHELLLSQKNGSGGWEHLTIAGDEDPFVGGYGFYASAAFDGTQVVMSNWVIDQPNYETWVEIHRQTVVVQ